MAHLHNNGTGREGAAGRPRLGHVHLRVADLERAVAFYRDVLDFTVTGYGPDFGLPLAFLALDDYHHHLALNSFSSRGGRPATEEQTGLHHLALLYPGREALGRILERIAALGWPVDGAEDHGATVSVYLRDPDGNGLELYYDRTRERWQDEEGRPVLMAAPFDWRTLLEEGPLLEEGS